MRNSFRFCSRLPLVLRSSFADFIARDLKGKLRSFAELFHRNTILLLCAGNRETRDPNIDGSGYPHESMGNFLRNEPPAIESRLPMNEGAQFSRVTREVLLYGEIFHFCAASLLNYRIELSK